MFIAINTRNLRDLFEIHILLFEILGMFITKTKIIESHPYNED